MDAEMLAGLGVAVFILAMSILVADEVGDPPNLTAAEIGFAGNR